jgi:hypothetical protein
MDGSLQTNDLLCMKHRKNTQQRHKSTQLDEFGSRMYSLYPQNETLTVWLLEGKRDTASIIFRRAQLKLFVVTANAAEDAKREWWAIAGNTVAFMGRRCPLKLVYIVVIKIDNRRNTK